MNPRRVFGQPAAPGIALGRIFEFRADDIYGDAIERPAVMKLPIAIQLAIEQLQALYNNSKDPDARAIIEFQIEFLSDPSLFDASGEKSQIEFKPVEVWCAAIGRQISDFSSSADDYFLHRVSDLRDMRLRVLRLLLGEKENITELPPDAILVADDISPSRFLSVQWGPHQAIVLRKGSPSSHTAILARGRALPMVVAVGQIPLVVGQTAIVNGNEGLIELTPDEEQLRCFHRRKSSARDAMTEAITQSTEPAFTIDSEQVAVNLNVSDLRDLDRVSHEICDGIGLVRTELLFANALPTETDQVSAYSLLLQWAAGKPVVVRTLDVGGDKPFPGLSLMDEANPFLGTRGVRLSFQDVPVFKLQIRALMRAAPFGDLRIMFPMVTNQSELFGIQGVIQQCAVELTREAISFKMPKIGVMIEVPALALSVQTLKTVHFASIGTNDLLQYFMAAARDNPTVSSLADANHPGFARLLKLIVDDARSVSLPISVCGDLAAREDMLPLLLTAGLRSISVPPASVPKVKQVVRRWSNT